MGFIRNLFDRKPYTEQQLAECDVLINAALGIAGTLYPLLARQYNEIDQIAKGNQLNDWNYYMTIAGVGVSYPLLITTASDKELTSYTLAIQKALNNWTPKSSDHFEEFVTLITHLRSKNILTDKNNMKQTVGFWVIHKLMENPNTLIKIINPEEKDDLFTMTGDLPCDKLTWYWKNILSR